MSEKEDPDSWFEEKFYAKVEGNVIIPPGGTLYAQYRKHPRYKEILEKVMGDESLEEKKRGENDMNRLSGDFEKRLRASISTAWEIFSEKVGAGLIEINKEASMQLHYAYILQHILFLICYSECEHAKIKLEKGIRIKDKIREADLVLIGSEKNGEGYKEYKIAVEMKCYREYASSGGKRGASDIFMKDVYQDLELLENYCEQSNFDYGIALVMNDLPVLVNPSKKEGKCWDYDTSQGYKVKPGTWKTPVGGKEVSIILKRHYHFNWAQKGNFWFLENEGQKSPL